jgi:hypothetical protein
MAGAGLIENYVGDLAERLRGDKRAKSDLLTETRDSLEDAAECYREAGLCAVDAERKAVADFGPVPVIARDYQAELAAAYGARTLRSILFVLPVVQLMWESTRLLWVGPWEKWGSEPPSWYYPFAQLNDSMVWAVAVAAALALLAGRFFSRRNADSLLMARCAAGVALVTTGASLLALLALVIATAAFDAHRLFLSPMTALAGVLSVMVMIRLAMMARRTALFCA